MSNYSKLLELIKQASTEAVEALNPAGVFFGVVTATNSLKISVEQKLELTKEFLILTKNVIDYNVPITIEGFTESCKVHNALKINDKVILLQVQGGQKYIVLDKVY